MQTNSIVKFFLILLTIVSLIQFMYILPANKVEKAADNYAVSLSQGISDQQEANRVMRDARASYLDSMSQQVVFKIPYIKNFTYDELKQQQIGLGLDLKGGISTVLQVDLKELLVSLSNNSKDPAFLKALEGADSRKSTAQVDYITLFSEEFNKVAEGKTLASIFARNSILREDINLNSPNERVVSVLRQKANETVSLTFNRLKDRINKFGVVQPNVSLDAARDLILVELPGVDNPERARSFLQATAKLEFWNVYRVSDNGVLSAFYEADDRLKTSLGTNSTETTMDSVMVPLYDTLGNVIDSTMQLANNTTNPSAGLGPLLSNLTLNSQTAAGVAYPLAVMGVAEKGKMATINAYLEMPEIKRLFPQDIKFLWSSTPMVDFQTRQATGLYELYAIKKDRGSDVAPLTGEHVVDATSTQDPNTKEIAVSIRMNNTGARIWADLTTKAAQDNNREVAIALDDEVVSCPRVNVPITDGNSSISGNFNLQEADDLANILQIGKLPAKIEIIQESLVGPSLGQENINKSLMSIMIGFAILLLFMVLYYATGGIVSIVALFANIFYIFAALSSFGTVLTLPGIAGIVLTIGMAVDANVIIYERIREELRAGKSLLTAIADGFKSSYSAIIDANVTTILTALVLAYYGIGPIKGFAVVLMIGVVCTMVTAVLLSKLLIDWWTITKGKSISFESSFFKNKFQDISFDWISKRKIAYAISGAFLILGAISFFVRGFELGVDFKGGRSYNVQFVETVDPQTIREELSKVIEGTPVVKAVSADNTFNITTSYLIAESGEEADNLVLSKLHEGVQNVIGKSIDIEQFKNAESLNSTHIVSMNKVGPQIADDIKSSSYKAAFFALLLIFIYILFRFSKWQYSAGAVVGLIHDGLVIMSIFTLLHGILPFSMEIDQAFIAALLTAVGYSINDKIIIFDRIREYYNSYAARSKKDLINAGVSSTLSRTIITSGTTLIVILSLLIFGGDSIKGFALALVVGVVVGSYSSVFISAPIMYDFSGEFSDEEVKQRAEELTALDENK